MIPHRRQEVRPIFSRMTSTSVSTLAGNYSTILSQDYEVEPKASHSRAARPC